jgi:hypothetical protein
MQLAAAWLRDGATPVVMEPSWRMLAPSRPPSENASRPASQDVGGRQAGRGLGARGRDARIREVLAARGERGVLATHLVRLNRIA